jgi:hypothetical protein
MRKIVILFAVVMVLITLLILPIFNDMIVKIIAQTFNYNNSKQILYLGKGMRDWLAVKRKS